MKILFSILALTLTAGLAVGALIYVRSVQSDRSRVEYAAAPFTPMAKDGAPLFALREFPDHGTPEEKASWRKDAAARKKYRTADGAIARASKVERESVLALEEDKYVKARELAETVLAEDPDSIVARFVLADVQYRGEENLPRALYEVRQARYRLESKGRQSPNDGDLREWYLRVLDLESEILGYLDRREEQLLALDRIESVYRPMPWRRLFPLIKQRRLDEVDEVLVQVDKMGGWKLRAMNTRSMLAEQRRDRAGCYRAGKDMTTTFPGSSCLWNNFGIACLNDFRINESESAYIRSATSSNQDHNSSAYFPLALIYVQQSRFQEAWHALKRGQAQRTARRPHTLGQDQGSAHRISAQVLLALGYGEASARLARLADEEPNRMGSTTVDERDDRYWNGLTLWAALRTRAEQQQESSALASLGGRLSDIDRGALRMEAWAQRRRLLKVLSDQHFLSEMLRPYLPGQDHMLPWLSAELMELLPTGVAAEALRQARAAEDHAGTIPCFDAMDSHLALRRGNEKLALEHAERALEKLPLMTERLMRARAAAVASEACRRLGDGEKSRGFARAALRDFPQVFRMMALTIPVRIESDDSATAKLLAQCLSRSTRFRIDSEGCRIQVKVVGEKLIVRMERQPGELHVEVETPIKGEPTEVVATAFRRFHDRLMSPWIDLTAVEINSLQGAAVRPKAGL